MFFTICWHICCCVEIHGVTLEEYTHLFGRIAWRTTLSTEAADLVAS